MRRADRRWQLLRLESKPGMLMMRHFHVRDDGTMLVAETQFDPSDLNESVLQVCRRIRRRAQQLIAKELERHRRGEHIRVRL